MRITAKRSVSRSHVLMAGRLRTAAGPLDCTILNVSASGARVRCAANSLQRGEVVGLTTSDHAEFPAVVVWRSGGLTGLAFIDGPAKGLQRWGARARKIGLA